MADISDDDGGGDEDAEDGGDFKVHTGVAGDSIIKLAHGHEPVQCKFRECKVNFDNYTHQTARLRAFCYCKDRVLSIGDDVTI